jgi:hypothetical protein
MRSIGEALTHSVGIQGDAAMPRTFTTLGCVVLPLTGSFEAATPIKVMRTCHHNGWHRTYRLSK